MGKLLPLSPVPLYSQLKELLRGRILDGVYPPLSRMPSENELGKAFDVSRITVRQALGDLQKEGLIFKIHGKGTFVARPKAFQNVSTLQGLGESMTQMGYEVINRLHGLRYVPAGARVAERLRVEEGSPVCEIKRVRLVNREPVSLEVTYLPQALGERLEKADLVTRDIFLILENDCGIPLGHADLAIDAVLADADSDPRPGGRGGRADHAYRAPDPCRRRRAAGLRIPLLPRRRFPVSPAHRSAEGRAGMNTLEQEYDIVVIGGGTAGPMAAIKARSTTANCACCWWTRPTSSAAAPSAWAWTG